MEIGEKKAKHDLLRIAYEAFNARDMERALSGMHHAVDSENGMEEEACVVQVPCEIIGRASGN